MLQPLIGIQDQPYYDAVELEERLGQDKRILLYDACELGHMPQVSALLDALVNPNISIEDRYGQVPLHAAAKRANINVIMLLLEVSADANIRDDKDRTPLWYAAKVDEVAGLILLHFTRDIDEKGSLVPRALKYSHFELASELLNRKAEISPSKQYSSLDIALENGQRSIAKKIVNYAEDLEDLFCKSVKEGNMDAVGLLLKYRFDINCEDDETGQAPLHIAARRGYSKIVNKLLKEGADINVIWKKRKDGRRGYTTYKWTPLAMAAKRGENKVVKSLLRNGADFRGESPFLEALVKHNFKTAKVLLEYGADVDECDKTGKLLLERFSGDTIYKDERVVEFLEKEGASYWRPIEKSNYTTTCDSEATEIDEYNFPGYCESSSDGYGATRTSEGDDSFEGFHL